jgi:glycerol-3-phosphate acyltransferase PlsX
MKIIVDAMGGDNAPLEIVRGALDANRKLGVGIILVGRSEEILKAVETCGEKTLPAGMEIKGATEVVEMSDDPAFAFKRKKDSSLTVGLTLLRDGVGDAFVSAGSTGALLSGATLVVKRIHGIRRTAMAPQVPCTGGHFVLCDCGANTECPAEYLLQFAFLGNYYAKRVMGIENPRVALLNIGVEEEKGDTLRHEALTVLKTAGEEGRIHFIGNIEATDAMMGGADVVVTDGFTGNIMLKSIEGTGKMAASAIKEMFFRSWKNQLAAFLVKNDFLSVKRLMDSREIGGTAFLGISKPVIKAHGSSDARAIRNAIRQARDFTASGFIDDVEKNIEYMTIAEPAGNA